MIRSTGWSSPVAQAYTYVTPQPVRSCVHNIFSNVGDLWSGANSMLQGRGHDFVNTLGRFLFNTTMGVGGCFDVASANGAQDPERLRHHAGRLGHRPGPVPGAAVLRLVHHPRRRRPGWRLLRSQGHLHQHQRDRQRAAAQFAVGPERGGRARQPAGRDQHDRPRGAGSVQLRARRLPATPRRHGAGPEGGRRVRAAELRRRRGRRQGRRPAMAPVVQPAK